jgi:predicted nucleic acid-binding protein
MLCLVTADASAVMVYRRLKTVIVDFSHHLFAKIARSESKLIVICLVIEKKFHEVSNISKKACNSLVYIKRDSCLHCRGEGAADLYVRLCTQ